MCRLSLQLSDDEKALFLFLDSVEEPSQKAESPSGDEQLEAADGKTLWDGGAGAVTT